MSIAGGPGALRTALVGPDVSFMSFVVRSATEPIESLPSVRRVIGAIDRISRCPQPQTLQSLLDRASAQMAFTMMLLAIAAGVALVLGLIGTYGVNVVHRQPAHRRDRCPPRPWRGPAGVICDDPAQGGRLSAPARRRGLAAALAGSRVIESLLYGVSPRDPAVFAATAILLLGARCWPADSGPARRAAQSGQRAAGPDVRSGH